MQKKDLELIIIEQIQNWRHRICYYQGMPCQQLAKLDQEVLKSSTVKWIFLFNASMFLTEKPPLEEETQYKMRKRT